jgi:magnesium transporter
MRSWIDHAGEVVWEPAPSLIAQLIEAGQPFWLDIENPTDELSDQLATRLGLHPLAVEDSKQFGQRAKLQVYGNGALLVGFGLDEQLREPVEVHCYYTTSSSKSWPTSPGSRNEVPPCWSCTPRSQASTQRS